MSEDIQPLSQYVVFELLERDYALKIEQVSEAIKMVAITPVQEAPTWLLGMIDLRENLIPVMDLRVRLGLPLVAPGLSTEIIVEKQVDLVLQEKTLPTLSITTPNALVSQCWPVNVMTHDEERLVTILNLERLTDITS